MKAFNDAYMFKDSGNQAMTKPAAWEKRRAMGVVNTLYELAEVHVAKRQSINDFADEVIVALIREERAQVLKEVREKVEAVANAFETKDSLTAYGKVLALLEQLGSMEV